MDVVNIVNGAGFVDDVLLVGGLLTLGYSVLVGLAPALWRLGYGLARRKIVVFAKVENFQNLRQLLLDAGIFKDKNIRHVHDSNELGAAVDATVSLVFWPDWIESVNEFIGTRKDSVPMIIYAPAGYDRIPDQVMQRLNEHRHTTVTNFRGRLLNDIVTAMITSSYEKR